MYSLSIKKVWKDYNFFEIEVYALSELISAKARSYTTKEAIENLSSHLIVFPETPDDRYIWESGTKGDDYTPYISLEFWCDDSCGHLIIEVYMEIDDGGSYNRHNCCFFVKTEVGLLNTFGHKLSELATADVGFSVTL